MKLPQIVIHRSLHISNAFFANNNAKRQTKMIHKLLHGRERGKKIWYPANEATRSPPSLPSPSTLSKPAGQGKEALRRIKVLNKLFMKNITDLMATGYVSEDIVGRQIEISQVVVTPDFHRVNVYWMAKGNENDTSIQTILDNSAHSIRHELSQLRLMGEVPKINFLKDKHYAKTTEVGVLLETADLGSAEEADDDKDASGVTQPPSIYDDLPKMPQDVFGLNHFEILEKIRRSMRKTKQAWEKYEYGKCREETSSASESNSDNTKTLATVESELRAADFQKYMEKRNFKKKDTPERKKSKTEQEYYTNVVDTIEYVEQDDYLDEDELAQK